MKKRGKIHEKFGKRVQEIRQQKEISSQMALGLKAKLDRTYIGGIERGERNITLEVIEKLAKALGVELRELFDF